MQQINTSCEYCIFRVNDSEGKQIGCSLNRLEAFKNQRVELEMVKDHFVIKKRFCNALRNTNWAKKQESVLDSITKELKIDYDTIIIVNKQESSLDDLALSVRSIIQQSPHPKNIRVSLAKHTLLVGNVISMLGELIPEDINYFVDDIKGAEDMSDWSVLDISAMKSQTMYYVGLEVGHFIPPQYALNINHALNGKLEKFCLLEPYENSGVTGLFTLKRAHKMVGGSAEIINEKGERLSNIVDKLKLLDDGSMIRKVSEICPIH